LARCSSKSGQSGIVLGLPGRHVVGQSTLEWALSRLLEQVLVLEPLSYLVVSSVVFLVLLEHFWVLSKILLIWHPTSVDRVLHVSTSRQIIVHSANIVVVHSVLDVLQVIVSSRHTQLEQLLGNLLLGILELVLKSLIGSIDLLSQCELGHFVVDLGKLLHLHVVFSDQVLLLLSQISQVVSG